MKRFMLVLALATIGGAAALAQDDAAKPADEPAAKPADEPAAKPADAPADAPAAQGERTLDQKASFIVGYDLGTRSSAQGAEFDLEAFLTGMRAAYAGEKSPYDEATVAQVMQAFQQQALAKVKQRGDAWLAANKQKEGVQVTASGLQYQVIEAGEGPQPTADQTVVVHYRGTLINGEEFDSSYARGKPAEFPVGRVIKGWIEALQMMKTGAKWKLFIPSELAYGANPDPRSGIPPHAPLVFEVELLEIK